ncbi:hypothetical protein IWZ03DRAFT_360029 [Phyllosticta citriasiana]|uniref:Uncharacterized protein n=1 Tax=Phyllosticta citriasiana TaxID=595635 RepID=A0ABR1KLX8_9PEZI
MHYGRSPEYEERGVFATVAFSQLIQMKDWQRIMPQVIEFGPSWCAKLYSNYTPIKSPNESVLASDSLFHVSCLDIDLTASFVVMNNTITIYNYGLTEGFPATGIALLQGGDIAGTMDNISIAMTRHIQESRNATTHQGTALYPEAVGVVRWAWLILPIALVLLSAVFLVLCML